MAEPMGFFTDTTVCIGCKACEVACKEWNQLPATNGGVEHALAATATTTPAASTASTGGTSSSSSSSRADRRQGRWLMMSDVCKHCVQAGCLEVCPTGAIIRTEFDTVVIQSDVCNGCRDCIAACPFGVIDINPVIEHGAEVHALLRPPPGRPGAGLLAGLPDQLDPVRADQRAASSAPRRRVQQLHEAGREAGLPLRRRREDARRAQLVLPAGRQAGGLRPARRIPKMPSRNLGPSALWSALGRGRRSGLLASRSASASPGPATMPSTFFTAPPTGAG